MTQPNADASLFDEQLLIRHAALAREKAYTPYSGFKVGCALLDADGTIHHGCNVENAAYGPTNCAERTAMFRAIADGKEQVLSELCAPNMPVILTNMKGAVHRTTVADLLPGAFVPANLEEPGR